ncbi:MAG: TRAP transporter substrate-binding protein [Woeseia sp.]|nr:TRAP transporter substrate-binding protein [Woeseia sp.]MBT8097521.1 TRAP transporter substrate-binding protein [Woeseia sp.]NNE59605.1 TRAP transporter substrate-binding protein [Woeseia sp.]NNL55218.1 TRAP transporter substrate-binding protein [Woeseia sp.]
MKRREFVGGLALAAGVTACGPDKSAENSSAASTSQTFSWNLVTSWPPGLPGLGLGVENLAENIERASGGRLKIRVYAGGELVPALEVFDAVRSGTAQMGHDASYYHRGKVPAAQYFTAIPFGLNANEMNAWLYYGGGVELWQELYADFGLVPFPAGQTGVQMAGWFNKEINTVDDLKGLKMRIPGLGGEVMQRAGATQVTVPASEIFTSLQTGAIDAAEWVGPYNDLSLGLHKAARYYYYPGWHEPGPLLECIINKEAWDTLPKDLQAIVEVCCQAINLDIQAEYIWGNAQALHELKQDSTVELREFPADVLRLLEKHSSDIVNELSERDPWAKRLQDSVTPFLQKSNENQRVSEYSFLKARIPGES